MSSDSKNVSSEISIEHKEDKPSRPSSVDFHHSRTQSSSPKNLTQRPPSPVTRHRTSKHEYTPLRRTRSNSPQKTFSYLSPDRNNLRQWKDQRRQIAKQQHDDRIYYENRQKLERLARIAREPSTYPSINLEQERQRQRHADDHHRKLLKSYIPILQNNLKIVNRLATIKGVYDRNKMLNDYHRHEQILYQDAVNRKKSRETHAQKPFILPKIHSKS